MEKTNWRDHPLFLQPAAYPSFERPWTWRYPTFGGVWKIPWPGDPPKFGGHNFLMLGFHVPLKLEGWNFLLRTQGKVDVDVFFFLILSMMISLFLRGRQKKSGFPGGSN